MTGGEGSGTTRLNGDRNMETLVITVSVGWCGCECYTSPYLCEMSLGGSPGKASILPRWPRGARPSLILRGP